MTLFRQVQRERAELDIRQALEACGGNVSAAARALEMSVRSLQRYLTTLNLRAFVAECRYRASVAYPGQQCHSSAELAQPRDTVPVPSELDELAPLDHDSNVMPEPFRRG